MKELCIGALVLGLVFATAGTAAAQERYYLILFGSNRGPLEPNYSHSFAIFVRAVRRTAPPAWHLEQHVISWMPATMQIRVGAHLPEVGSNLTYHTSLLWALATQQRITMWGPCEIVGELYWRARQQVARLQAGEVLYKALDARYPTELACNCIHALDAISGGPRVHVGFLIWGATASARILERYTPWLIHPEVNHDWLLPQLDLDCYPVVRRSSASPHSHPGLNSIPPGSAPAGPWVGYSLRIPPAAQTVGTGGKMP